MSELIFIGTSDAFGAGGRRQSAYLVRGPSGGLLLDCGQTTCTGLEALGIDRGEVDTIAVSHFHGDHFGGIPMFLLASQYADARRTPIRIVGPPTTEARVRAAAEALGHPIEDKAWSYPIQFVELPTGQEVEVGPATLRTFATHHQQDACPHGIVVDTGEHRITYSGDTGWFDTLPEQVNGSDLFLCECTQKTRGYEFHLSLEELEDKRSSFDCGRWILTHLGAEMRAMGDAGPFELADDGLVIKL
jgi:ribonuclease BN (tRNA processing enzyme)